MNRRVAPPTFQEMLLALERFWAERGCVIAQPYSSEVGAGTFNPATFLRALGPEPWRVAHVEPSRRPKDGRYGENPNRFQQFFQYQVLLKPAPADVLDLYLQSLDAMGIDTREHDIRFVEDDWESPTLGAWGLGWQVWMDGTEISQFTYFQQCGGIDLEVISAELTYGLERIAQEVQGLERVHEVVMVRNPSWPAGEILWQDLWLRNEQEYSRYNFEEADVAEHLRMFDFYEREAVRLLDAHLMMPGYDCVIKCSHLFNMLDARGAISVSERVGFIARVRKLARRSALAYVKQREEMGYPLGRADAPEASQASAVGGGA